MNILLITPYYPPIISSLSTMMQELAEALSAEGHTVTVISAFLQNKISKKTRIEKDKQYQIENDIGVIRIKTRLLNSKIFMIRGISQLLLPFIFGIYIKKYMHKKG